MLGHELRNPLSAVSNSVLLLERAETASEQAKFARGVIARQTSYLVRLIDDLLDVGRVMTGKVVLERAPFELAAAVRQVAAALGAAGRFAQRRVALDATPVWVDGDQTRVEQIVSNLVVNAVKFTAASGSIQIRVAPENGAALIEVSDDGRGIARENLERVFELFYQDEAGGDRSGGGLGIGLTVVRRLAELHGGSVAVRSEGKGRGASFTVRLPAMAAAPAAEPELPVQDAGLAHAILLVEDNEDERESLRVALELKGQSVLHAADGHMALELLRRFRPPAAILDIGLPGMNGYELARAARAALGQDILLVALTGYGSEADRLRALAAGFDHHFTKPVEIAELMQVLALARARADARSNQSGLSADQKIA
jgi:CheY-like chemotaxis protein